MSRFQFLCCLLAMFMLLSLANHNAATSAKVACSSPYCIYMPIATILQPVYIADVIGSYDRSHKYFIKGDVTAIVGNQVTGVVLEAQVFDLDQLLGTFTGTTELTATLLGQLNPFIIGTNISTYEHPLENLHQDIRAIEWNSDGSPAFAPLTVVMTQTEEYIPLGTTVTATFRNDESLPMTNVWGMAWSFCQENISDKELLAVDLAPGETISYTKYLSGVGGICIPEIRYTAQGQLSTEAKTSANTSPFRLAWLDPFWGWDIIEPGKLLAISWLKAGF